MVWKRDISTPYEAPSLTYLTSYITFRGGEPSATAVFRLENLKLSAVYRLHRHFISEVNLSKADIKPGFD